MTMVRVASHKSEPIHLEKETLWLEIYPVSFFQREITQAEKKRDVLSFCRGCFTDEMILHHIVNFLSFGSEMRTIFPFFFSEVEQEANLSFWRNLVKQGKISFHRNALCHLRCNRVFSPYMNCRLWPACPSVLSDESHYWLCLQCMANHEAARQIIFLAQKCI